MQVIERSAVVPYSATDMYRLVDNIEEYPRFLSWCSASKILKRGQEDVLAELEFHFKGIKRVLTTRNRLIHNQNITLELIKGPFNYLKGLWAFTPLTNNQCEIRLYLEFEFAHNITGLLFRPVFAHAANSLLDAFCQQAKKLSITTHAINPDTKKTKA